MQPPWQDWKFSTRKASPVACSTTSLSALHSSSFMTKQVIHLRISLRKLKQDIINLRLGHIALGMAQLEFESKALTLGKR